MTLLWILSLLYIAVPLRVGRLPLGVVPAIVLLVVALGGWRGRPVLTSVTAATSGAALGAIVVHVTCPAQGAWHVMLGHYVFPLATAALVGGAAALIWRHLSRR